MQSSDLNKIVEEYYREDLYGNTKIKKIIDNFLKKIGGISQKDYDDFYSVGNETFTNALKSYDGKSNFHTYICSCLINKLKTEMTRRNRQKRSIMYTDENGEKIFLKEIPLDAPIDDCGNVTLGDTIEGKSNIEEYIENLPDEELSERVQIYLDSLTPTQQKICKYIMKGLDGRKIKQELGLTEREYNMHIADIKSFKKTQCLNNSNNIIENNKKEEDLKMVQEQSCEKSMTKSYSIASIIKKMREKKFRFDYAGQRTENQWTPKMKGNLISDILQGNPIPDIVLAEEVCNGHPVIWDIDGKQRCTIVEAYSRDVFSVSSSIKRPLIKYSTFALDENGEKVVDDDGEYVYEWKEFDIRRKKYSQLPEELKEKFNDYVFRAVQYINCTKDEIDYHIGRYNEGKAMNKIQKGIVLLGYDMATLVKSISSSDFFSECCCYKSRAFTDGKIERIVLESLMAAYFEKEWKKNVDKLFEYSRDNITNEMLCTFGEYLAEIEPVVNNEAAEMFRSADAFLYLAGYIRSRDAGLTPKQYIDFITEFKNTLINKKINGRSYNDVVEETRNRDDEKSKSGTKDTVVIIEKINILMKLVEEYFNISIIKSDDKNNVSNGEAINTVKLAETDNIVNLPIYNEETCSQTDEQSEDTTETNNEFMNTYNNSEIIQSLKLCGDAQILNKGLTYAKKYYESIENDMFEMILSILDDWTLNILETSNILNPSNIPALIGVVAYATYKELDREGEEWFIKVAKFMDDNNIRELSIEEMIKNFDVYMSKQLINCAS